MHLSLGNIQNELARELAQNGTPIRLTWRTLRAGSTPDPVTGAAVWDEQTSTLPALVHVVAAAGVSQVRQFNEIEVGDVILDFAGDADLDGKADLTFWVSGRAYVAKEIGARLAKTWDATVQDRQLFRSVLVKPKM